MFTGKNVKKFVIVFLIISLIYANLSTTILGVISYAQENTEVTKPKEKKKTNLLRLKFLTLPKMRCLRRRQNIKRKLL